MPLDANLFASIPKPKGRRVVFEIHETLRSLILSGRLPPGTILSQVEVARVLGVSRTPAREALRMLQEGGLVSAEPNFRCRVLGFDPDDIEALYMKRLVLEALGAGITAIRMTAEQRDELGGVVEALESEAAHSSFETWLVLHRKYHELIVRGAGEVFAADLKILELRSERYQSAYKGAHLPGWWLRGELEHREIFNALVAGDPIQASELAARHLARTALELLAALAPEHDTSRLRLSLRFACQAASGIVADQKSAEKRRDAAVVR
jgi:DNA-binding GntR family transcriptional regulator